jgi:DNA-binding NarL/FixJ family response regulator
VEDINMPQLLDAPGKFNLYNQCVTRVFLADPQMEERSALCLLLNDINMAVVGEATDWSTALTQIPLSGSDMVLIDWELLPADPSQALEKIRSSCPRLILIILLLNTLDSRQQAELASIVDMFINKQESPRRIAAHLRQAARRSRHRISDAGQAGAGRGRTVPRTRY